MPHSQDSDTASPITQKIKYVYLVAQPAQLDNFQSLTIPTHWISLQKYGGKFKVKLYFIIYSNGSLTRTKGRTWRCLYRT